MKLQAFKNFSEEDHATWKRLFERLDYSRQFQAHPLFTKGVASLHIPTDRVPDINEINVNLSAATGFRGVPVEGLEDARSFFEALADKTFPIGNFLRDAQDLNYTPAPDIFHDLYGHLPLLADPDYAAFTQRFGLLALEHGRTPEILRQFERLYWFGVEFPLVKTPDGQRIFGGGILSSYGECNYAISSVPKVAPFDVDVIRHLDYRIDTFQETLFLMDSPAQLYQSADRLVSLITK